jgi:serine/alanine adding enzyme
MVNVVGTSVSIEGQENYLDEWREYINSCPSATIYHLPEWSEVLESSFGYRPYHLMAKNTDGKLEGVLPLVFVDSSLTRGRLVSLPFSYLCGPVAETSDGLNSLLEKAKALCDRLGSRYLEIKVMKTENDRNSDRCYRPHGFEVSEQFSTFILELCHPDTVWKKLDPKSVRWAVGKAKRDGVVVRRAQSIEDIRRFYRLNLKTKRRIGVPGHPEHLFLNMFKILGEKCALYLADFNKETIAGIIILKFNNTVLYGYGASDDNYRAHQPNSLLVWTAIEDSCREGYRYFDFGRTSPAETSLTSFKKHWGTEEKVLSYYYYPKMPNSLALNDTGIKYRMATGLWKKLPLPIAEFCSNKIFSHLG